MDECTNEHFLLVLKTQIDDTNKVNTLFILCQNEHDLNKAIQYANDALMLSKKINFNSSSVFSKKVAKTGEYFS